MQGNELRNNCQRGKQIMSIFYPGQGIFREYSLFLGGDSEKRTRNTFAAGIIIA